MRGGFDGVARSNSITVSAAAQATYMRWFGWSTSRSCAIARLRTMLRMSPVFALCTTTALELGHTTRSSGGPAGGVYVSTATGPGSVANDCTIALPSIRSTQPRYELTAHTDVPAPGHIGRIGTGLRFTQSS